MDYLLGIDAGTTSVKAAIFTADGRCIGMSRKEYQLDTPNSDQAQLNPNIYWQACVHTVNEAVKQAGINVEQIQGLSVSSQGETIIALDAKGNPIYPALVWLDNRAMLQAKKLAKIFNAKVYGYTGIPEIVPTWSACKILWIKENEPDIFARTNKFLLVQDYLIFRLTGKYFTDGSVSSTTLYFNIMRNNWWEEVLYAIGINAEQLPEIVSPGTIIGRVSSVAAYELGLSINTQVICGGMDQSVGAIGAGNYQSGIISETTGAALTIQATISDPMIDTEKLIPVYFHSVPKKFLFVPVCPTAGMAFKWFRDQFGQQEISFAENQGTDSYDLMTRMAETIPAGSDGLVMLPHLMGSFSPDPNPLTRGSFTGFTLSHTRAHFVRALMEGVGFMLKQNIQTIEKAGIKINEVVSTGGGARSRLWNKIKSNILDKPLVTLHNEETALIGNAILAGVACGIYKTIDQGGNAMIARNERILPDKEAAAYIRPYKMYCILDRVLSEYYKSSI
jgi:sugar (pentulose or hexulose) kinase